MQVFVIKVFVIGLP